MTRFVDIYTHTTLYFQATTTPKKYVTRFSLFSSVLFLLHVAVSQLFFFLFFFLLDIIKLYHHHRHIGGQACSQVLVFVYAKTKIVSSFTRVEACCSRVTIRFADDWLPVKTEPRLRCNRQLEFACQMT